jgi:hypothetical protein
MQSFRTILHVNSGSCTGQKIRPCSFHHLYKYRPRNMISSFKFSLYCFHIHHFVSAMEPILKPPTVNTATSIVLFFRLRPGQIFGFVFFHKSTVTVSKFESLMSMGTGSWEQLFQQHNPLNFFTQPAGLPERRLCCFHNTQF